MIIRIACIALMSAPVFCMDNTPAVVCGIAQERDLPGILALYEKAATNGNDKEKIVIFPSEVREDLLRASLAKKRLFVAKVNDTVVAFKKNYIVTDPNELQEILTQEFRFTEDKVVSQRNVTADKNSFSGTDFVENIYRFSSKPVYIYTGSDFTAPDRRGEGINTELSSKALELVLSNANGDSVNLIFGLTEPNAELIAEKGHIDRVPGIAKIFASHMQRIHKLSDPVKLTHHKTKAYMPHFTLVDGKLTVSSDAESTPGFGNILAYTHIKDQTTEDDLCNGISNMAIKGYKDE